MLNSTQKENLKIAINEIVKSGLESKMISKNRRAKSDKMDELIALDGFWVSLLPLYKNGPNYFSWRLNYKNTKGTEVGIAIEYSRDVYKPRSLVDISLAYRSDRSKIYLGFIGPDDKKLPIEYRDNKAYLKLSKYCDEKYYKEYDASDLSAVIDTVIDDLDEYLDIYASIPESDYDLLRGQKISDILKKKIKLKKVSNSSPKKDCVIVLDDIDPSPTKKKDKLTKAKERVAKAKEKVAKAKKGGVPQQKESKTSSNNSKSN